MIDRVNDKQRLIKTYSETYNSLLQVAMPTDFIHDRICKPICAKFLTVRKRRLMAQCAGRNKSPCYKKVITWLPFLMQKNPPLLFLISKNIEGKSYD